MRYVYLDEAGTSASEPVTVVVGVIVDADKHWQAAYARIQKLFDEFVPPALRENFIFHAKSIWGDQKIRDIWSREDRLALLHGMMNVPHELGLCISLGMMRREPDFFSKITVEDRSFEKKITPSQLEHLIAFELCLSEADRYIREYGDSYEVGTVVAENVPEMEKFLKWALPIRRGNPKFLPLNHIRPTIAEKKTGVIVQNREFKVTRLVDAVHFVNKEDGPLLQIADACAFGFRRWLSNQSSGDEFLKSIVVDHRLVKEDWAGPMSCGLFYWHQKKRPVSYEGFFQKLARIFGLTDRQKKSE